jgi:hypothetical protein
LTKTSQAGHIVVTSRRSDQATVDMLESNRVQLGMLTPEDASVYLFRASKGRLVEKYSEIQAEIRTLPADEAAALAALIGNSETCGLDGLPLALEQAGAYILRTGRGFVYYKQFYERRMLELFDMQRARKGRADDTDKDGRSVTTTWAINVADLSVEAVLVLDCIACFHPDHIQHSLILRLVSMIEEGDIVPDVSGAEFSLKELVTEEMIGRFSLLSVGTESDGSRSFAIHRLMRLVVHSRDDSRHRATAITRALGALYAETHGWEYVNDCLLKFAHFPPIFARELCHIALSPLGKGFAAMCYRPLGA